MGLLGRSTSIGLELDTGAIRVAAVSGGARRPVLSTVGSVEIPEQAVVTGVVEESEMVRGALRELWGQSRVGGRTVVLGMSTPGMLMRSTTFPRVPDDRLEQAVHLQAGDYFPIPMNQLVMDFAVLGETETEEGAALNLLMVAARREQLHANLDCLRDAGLSCDIIDASPLVLARHLPESARTETVVVADIANGLTSLAVVDQGVPRFARVLPVSLESYAETLSVSLAEVPLDAAADAEVTAGAESWALRVADEISSSVNYFIGQNEGGSVDSVYVSGRGSRVPGLTRFLLEQLDMPVEQLNPAGGLHDTRARGFDPETGGADYSVAIGLALRGLEGVG